MIEAAKFQDYQVPSTLSGGRSSLPANVAAARAAGLSSVCLTENVTGSTTWVPEFVSAVRRVPRVDGLRVLMSVEVAIHDLSGRAVLPSGLRGLDLIHLSVGRFPGPDGPLAAYEVVSRMQDGVWTVADVVAMLFEAQLGAMTRLPGAVLAHPFSVLRSLGLSEADLPDAAITALAAGAAASATTVLVSEEWRSPGPRVVAAMLGAGVRVVAGSGARDSAMVGRYRYVERTLGSLVSH